jgi:polyribonucleotide nucleotidyltransferase
MHPYEAPYFKAINMTLEQLIFSWASGDSETRYNNFIAWVNAEIQAVGGAAVTSYFRDFSLDESLVDFNYGGTDEALMQVSVEAVLFEEASPDAAITIGQLIIEMSQAYKHEFARQKEYKKQKEARKDYNKEYQKQLEKWLDKKQKELLKEQAKAYEEMAKYFAKKYADYGSL